MTTTISPYHHHRDKDAGIADLHNDVRAWEVATGQVEVFGDNNDDLHDIPTNYLLTHGGFWVARDDNTGNIVGIVALRRVNATTGKVKRLAVHPNHHGQRIGLALMTALVNTARRMGLREIRLETGEHEHGRAIYESLGFEVTGWTEEFRDWQMTLRLPEPHMAGQQQW